MIIETTRNVDELEEYIKDAIDRITNNDNDIDIDISGLKVSDITIKDLCTMASTYENTIALYGIDIDKFLLYWLESKDIEYDIKSEYNIDLKEYKDKGYNIIRIWNSNNNQEYNAAKDKDKSEEPEHADNEE